MSFLYTSSEQVDFEIKIKKLFTIKENEIKVSLTKHLHAENYTMPMKEIKEDIHSETYCVCG